MKEFQHNNENNKGIYSKWVLLLLLVLIAIAVKGLVNIYTKESASREEMNLVNSKNSALQQRYDELSNRVNDLKTDQGLEKEIRSKFDVVKPGEQVILVVDKSIPAPIPQETSVIKKIWNGVVKVFKKTP